MRDLFDDDNNDKDSSEFARLFENSIQGIESKLTVGDRVKSEILSIGKEEVFVSTGTVDDGQVMKKDLVDENGQFSHKVGDSLDLFVTRVQGGQILLSPKATAKNIAEDLEDAFDMMLPVEGRVTEVINGGFRVSVLGKTAFCPISQIDLKRVDDGEAYVGRKFEFIITQFSERGRNIVVSRRKLLEEQREVSQTAFADDHRPGDVLKGVVSRLEKFGAFIEVATGLEGLCHISELSWSRVADPSEVVSVGQAVSVKVLKIEDGNGRLNISLSLKQVDAEPWTQLPDSLREGQVVEGRVTRCLKFGAFVELAPGIEGLIPLSEMSYTKRVVKSDDLIKEGEKVSVLIKEIRADERRMLLSLKDAGADPWVMFIEQNPEGSIIKGRVERREPYGLFVRLGEGVVALLPKSKAMENPEFPFEKLKTGDETVVQISEIKRAERKISLCAPLDPEAGDWRDYSAGKAASSFNSLGDQFKSLFDSGTVKVSKNK